VEYREISYGNTKTEYLHNVLSVTTDG